MRSRSGMKHRAIVLFLALCILICLSILYTIIVYLSCRRPQVSIDMEAPEFRPVILLKISKYPFSTIASESAIGKDAPGEVEHSFVEEQNFRNITLSGIPPEIPTTANATPSIDTTSVGVQIPFDPYRMDTIVYMHIQKTGGSVFLAHLVTAQIPLKRLKIFNDSGKVPSPDPISQSLRLCLTSPTGGWKRGRSHYDHKLCPRNWTQPNGDTWLVSEKTTAWNCGVHAYYTDFKRCLQYPFTFNQISNWEKNKDKVMRLSEHNRFHYVVLLRHPLLRYISEYLQISRGSCWAREDVCYKGREFRCPEHFQCKEDIRKKFAADLTLEKFLRCKDSWSSNRMTLMLADHEVASCWDRTKYTCEERDQLLLTSAKSNLHDFSYFGLNEFFADSGALFEETFGVVLRHPTENQSLNRSYAGLFFSSLTLEENTDIYKKVIQNNLLDLELYEYALDLFTSRMRIMGKELDINTLTYIQMLNDAMHKYES